MTPQERAWTDYAAEAAAMPELSAARRVEFADRMMKTTGGQMRVLSYSLDDLRDQLREPALAAGRKLRAFMEATRR